MIGIIIAYFDRYPKSKNCKSSFTLLEDDDSFVAFGESFTTWQSEPYVKIFNQIEIFGVL